MTRYQAVEARLNAEYGPLTGAARTAVWRKLWREVEELLNAALNAEVLEGISDPVERQKAAYHARHGGRLY